MRSAGASVAPMRASTTAVKMARASSWWWYLRSRLDGEDAEDLIGDQDDVAVRLHQLMAERRLDQGDRQAERRIGRGRAAAGRFGRAADAAEHRIGELQRARGGLEDQPGHVLAHVGERLVLAAGRARVAVQVADDVPARDDRVGPQHAIGDDAGVGQIGARRR